MKLRGRRRYMSPFFAGRHPFQLYLLAVGLISGLPLVLSLGTSRSEELDLPPVILLIWGLFLVIGSVTALVGTYWPSSVLTRMSIERVGLTAVGYGALLYGGLSAVENPEVNNVVALIFLLGFAGACLLRSHDIANEIKTWVARASEGK